MIRFLPLSPSDWGRFVAQITLGAQFLSAQFLRPVLGVTDWVIYEMGDFLVVEHDWKVLMLQY